MTAEMAQTRLSLGPGKRARQWKSRWPFRLATAVGIAILLVVGQGRGEIVLQNYSAANPIKIMAIGDSITDDCAHSGGWRMFLQPMLETNGYPFTFVGRQSSSPSGGFTKTLHEGYCGSVIAAPGMMTIDVHGYAGTNLYLLNIVPDALTNTFPDLVLIVMGANDIGRGRDPYWVATNDMPQLLDLIFSRVPAANIIITKTTSFRNTTAVGYAAFQTNVPIYNASVQNMVNQRRALGQNLFLADMYSAVDYYTMFDSDHLHPNPLGLNAMAKEFLSRIQAITIRTNSVTARLVEGGAEWKYSDRGQDLGTNWVVAGYDDSGWSRGIARLGYDTLYGSGALGTTISYGPDKNNKYPTTYYRNSFVVEPDVAYTNLHFRLTRVDGALVWLNGKEIFRVGMPAGPIAYTNFANTHVVADGVYTYYPTNIAVSGMPAGTNQLAVEVHIAHGLNLSSGFDMELFGTGYVPPPSLVTSRAGGQFRLSWSAGSGAGYSLYSCADLSPAGAWNPAGLSLQTNASQISTMITPDNGWRFYRLQKQ